MPADPIPRYPNASTEPLDVIRRHECHFDPGSLTTKRAQALWNEIERLRWLLAAPSSAAEVEAAAEALWRMMGELPSPDANGWRPIECAPKNIVLILSDGRWICLGGWSDSVEGWGFTVKHGEMHLNLALSPTHWQPLPEGPVAAAEDK